MSGILTMYCIRVCSEKYYSNVTATSNSHAEILSTSYRLQNPADAKPVSGIVK